MKKLFCVFSLAVLAVIPGITKAQLVPWKAGIQFTWDDFQGPCPHNGYSAETRWDYKYHYNWAADGTLTFTVVCSFDKQKSWKDPSKDLTPKLMMHELMHFHAAELYARKMRQAFSNYALTHKHNSNTDKEVSQIFNSLKQECDNYQGQYDTATNHGRIDKEQEEWTKKIAADLINLRAYEAK